MKKIILSLFLVCNFVNYAQTKKITLKDAISFALEHKAEAVKAKLEVQKARYTIAEARANALPNITLQGGVTHNIKLQETVLPNFINPAAGDIRISMGQPWTSNAVASATQVIFNQAVFTGLRAARTTREFYQINEELSQEQIIEKVATAYYQVFQAKQALANIDANLQLTQKTASIIENLHKTGLAKKIDVDRVSVALSNLKAGKQQALNASELTQNALKFIIGMPIEQEIELSEEAFKIDYETAFENGNVKNRTEIKLLEKQRELLKFSKKATIADYYPSLVAVANYGYLGQGTKNPLFNGESKGVYWSDFSSVGLNISIPIFKGFGTRAKVKKAQIALESLEADIQNTYLAMNLAYKNASTQLMNNLLTVEMQKENVVLAQKVLTNIQNNYKQGLATLTDLLDAERSLTEAKNSQTNALLAYKLAEIEMLKSVGELKKLQK